MQELRKSVYEGAMDNAQKGLCLAQLELRHHMLLLFSASDAGRTEAEIKGYNDAIERDKKAINNWETQIRAIKYEQKASQ